MINICVLNKGSSMKIWLVKYLDIYLNTSL